MSRSVVSRRGPAQRALLAGDAVVVRVEAVMVAADDANRAANVVRPVATPARTVVVADVRLQAGAAVVGVALALAHGGRCHGGQGGEAGDGERSEDHFAHGGR